MPRLRTTWIVTHERRLEPDEDPATGTGPTDPDALLWALDEGTVTLLVEIIES